MKSFTAALADYDRAIAIRPDFAEAYGNRGNALRELGRHSEALDACNRALALKPDYNEGRRSAIGTGQLQQWQKRLRN